MSDFVTKDDFNRYQDRLWDYLKVEAEKNDTARDQLARIDERVNNIKASKDNLARIGSSLSLVGTVANALISIFHNAVPHQ